MKVSHGIWDVKKKKAMTRASFFMVRNPNKEGKTVYMSLPLKLRNLLKEKGKKFKLKYVEFTYAFDPEQHLGTLSILHPHDNYNKKIGWKIATNRLNEFTHKPKELIDKYPFVYCLSEV